MGLKQCEKCGETVDEAKAFCPACGNAFVEEEKRQKASEYDAMNPTVDLGKTAYGQMMSDLGLNVAKAPPIVEKRVEVIAPIGQPQQVQPVQPAVIPPTGQQDKPASRNYTKWLIIGGIVLFLGFLLVVAAAVIVFIYWTRFR